MNARTCTTATLLLILSVVACSSTNGGSTGSNGVGAGSPDASSPSSEPDGGAVDTTGGMDFVFTNDSGANTTRTAFQVGAVMGSFCMASAGTSKECSFTGSIYTTANGCLATLNVAFVGALSVGASFPLVADAPVPDGSGFVAYSETCGTETKSWHGSGGVIELVAVTPPSGGLTTGTLSFTVTGAAMAPAASGGGTAQGTFQAAGSSKGIGYTGT